MDPPQVPCLLISLLVNLLLLKGQVSCSVLKLHLLLFDLLLQVSYLLVVLRHRLLQLHVTGALLIIDICFESLDARLNRVKGYLLDKDLF